MRQPADSRKRQAALVATMAASALLLLVLGFEVGRSIRPPANAVREPATATGSPALQLSVFDQPRPLPEIHFTDEQGAPLTLADFRGRAVLLNLWATWCVPCRKEMPALDRLQAALGGDRFRVVALSIDRDGAAAVRPFYQELGIERLAIYADPSGRGSHGLGIPGVPTSLLIDPEGREVARRMGDAAWDGPEVTALIERVIGGRMVGEPEQRQ